MKHATERWLRLALGGMLTFAIAGSASCSDPPTDPDTGPGDGANDADTEPVDAPDSETGASDVVECEAGTIVRCAEENTQSIMICQGDGTGTEPASCPPSTVCREGECVEVDCIPGRGKCDGETPKVCNEAGEKYVEQEPCSEGESCQEGACLNRCKTAAATNSYIGCEYWATELENHLLYEERETGSPIPNNQMPPYAIVLANTSSEYKAKVTILKDKKTPAKAIGSRTVGADIQTPGLTKETVHSELVKEDGRRIIGPKQLDGRKLVKVPIPKNSLLTVILPNRQIPHGKTTLRKYAYKINSTEPIVAYQFNPYCCNYNYTNDASLLLPRSALTENYTYMSYPTWDAPNRQEGSDPQSATISVLATEPDTEVTVDLQEPDKQGLNYKDVLYPIADSRISEPDSQGRVSVTMQPFEVLNIAGGEVGEDFTGARIDASKPVSTFGAHSCAYVPFSKPACDHLEQQLLPMETWGSKFVATPLKKRGPEDKATREGTYWKFLAQESDTTIETGLDLRTQPGGVLPAAGEGVSPCKEFSPEPKKGEIELDVGETCEFGTQTTFTPTSNNPVLLGAYLSGQNSVEGDVSHAGDPAFFLVPPEKQYRKSYSFLTPETYHVDYVTVMIDADAESVTLDGQKVKFSEIEHYEEYPDQGVARAHLEVEPGPHTLSSENRAFSFVSYGYHDYVSYAYTGGLDLAKYNDIE